ncbi:MAG: hypothetical protein HWQ38_27825 [Nostoc sp. NMS7]|uniref:hypothetical protein n=1 Tax=Nostoc sp. NMS7 TaxID=2815391 RepID=UPI0025F539CC|nr:hypothetical protein [Nostoc sp. NMS7]MBN3950074.1 hypothetical protein [Nostoc sp. NMS7]
MAYDFHPDAKQELDDAVAYYDNISRENWCQLNIKRAVRNRVYTSKTHGGGLRILDFVLVHGGGLCLCSREFHSPRLKLTPMIFFCAPTTDVVKIHENCCK